MNNSRAEILRLKAAGAKNVQIAAALSISRGRVDQIVRQEKERVVRSLAAKRITIELRASGDIEREYSLQDLMEVLGLGTRIRNRAAVHFKHYEQVSMLTLIDYLLPRDLNESARSLYGMLPVWGNRVGKKSVKDMILAIDALDLGPRFSSMWSERRLRLDNVLQDRGFTIHSMPSY